MRALAQPNGRYDLIIRKNTLPGSRGDPCPFPDSYAPATIRYIFAYILPPGTRCVLFLLCALIRDCASCVYQALCLIWCFVVCWWSWPAVQLGSS